MPKNDPPADGPRLGAFILMTVILLLFFGLVSRVGDLSTVMRLDRQQETTDMSAHILLEDDRRAVVAILGGEPTPGPVPTGTRPVGPAPQEVTPPAEEPGYPQGLDGDATDPETPPQPRPLVNPAERVHVVKPGETLYSIATRVLGNGSRFPEIQALNTVLRNRAPRVGDPYNTRFVWIPVKLKAGANDFLFRGFETFGHRKGICDNAQFKRRGTTFFL